MVIEITIGDLRWCSSSTLRLLAVTMSDGIRLRRVRDGADTMSGEEMTGPIFPISEKGGADPVTAGLAFIHLNLNLFGE
jgi:hypothetical protein